MFLNYTWLPSDTPDRSEQCLEIYDTDGAYLITHKGKKIYDGISSWWCKPLGHKHPIVLKAIYEQLKYFEHHIPANALNNVIEELSIRLVNIFTQMDKVIYASDGSSAIEIAMKLSYEVRVLSMQPERSKFIALQNGYHGETVFALSVCGIEHYRTKYRSLLQNNYFIEHIPYVNGYADPKWHECDFNQEYWNAFFIKYAPQATALIIEPIVQGAGGLKIISLDFMIKLIKLAKQYGLHIISDEIMVGLGRLGYYSVSKELLNFEPDLVCFAKNLTAGSIPMSAVVINRSISNVFRRYNQSFHHSHTHSCNALAASVAVSYLKWIDSTNVLAEVKVAENTLKKLMDNLNERFLFIKNPRVIGAIAACELDLPSQIIEQIFKISIHNGIYLRPIGNTLYIMPPIYNILTDIKIINIKLYDVLKQIAFMLTQK
mgnify:CR=1 FL=1